MQGRSVITVVLLLLGLMLAACTSDDADDTAADDGSSDTVAAVETNNDGDQDSSESNDDEAEAETDEDAESETDAETDDATEETSGESSDSASSGEIDVEHAQGTTTVPLNPEVVAVFDYSVINTLDELGVSIAGLPQGSLPPFLSKFDSDEFQNIGTLFEPDYEQVNALDPDLIIVAGRSAAVYEELADMAPTIDLTVDAEDFLNSFKERSQTLGMIFEQEDDVESALAEIDETVERIQGLAAENESRALIVMVSGGQVTAYGPGSRFGLIHDLLGVAAVEDDIEAATHGDAISFEFIQDRNPDILYVLDRDAAIGEAGEAAEVVLDNELVHSTNAWTNDAVYYLDTTTWYLANAGLGTFAEMLAEIEQSLQ